MVLLAFYAVSLEAVKDPLFWNKALDYTVLIGSVASVSERSFGGLFELHSGSLARPFGIGTLEEHLTWDTQSSSCKLKQTFLFRALRDENKSITLYRIDAQKLEAWASIQNANSLVEFSSREGEVENILKDISKRAATKGSFSYSRFFAIGLFRLLELANATEPTILEKLCAALNVNKQSVDRDLDVYRNLLSKLVQAKELMKEYVTREKKKREERENQKPNEAVKKCLGIYPIAGWLRNGSRIPASMLDETASCALTQKGNDKNGARGTGGPQEE
ncbi:hypothetical protein DM860_017781 [Cuscuta australis]|uniref:Uncharacterized protein n=1 Tax=Cuscuta australis TaxID=267555 RepID=A0A328DWB3_9ASTE|nr:hypothetical protein DM860_017781 [Cuscuta australis]